MNSERRDLLTLFAVPLLIVLTAAIEIPWYFVTVLITWFKFGDPELTRAEAGVVGTIASVPAMMGVLLGVSVIVRRLIQRPAIRHRMWLTAIVVAVLGVAACCAEIPPVIYAMKKG